ncbi:MAG: sulfotransferase domain-containing protein [Candidatus Binatales bacterium]
MSASGRKLPDFIAVGPPRTGTTWLDRVLRDHVSLPENIKETNFFTANFSKGLDWYEDHFRTSVTGRPRGEICPSYFTSADARERIADNIPRCAIICTLRDPVARIYSDYRHLRILGRFGVVSFEQVIAGHGRSTSPKDMFATSTYSKLLRAWYEKFGKENVLALVNDDLVSDPQRYLDQVCRFVRISPIDLSRSPLRDNRVNPYPRAPRSVWLARRAREVRHFMRRHRQLYSLSNRLRPLWKFCSGGGKEFGPIDPAIEASLREYFRPDVEALEEMLQRDLSAWK